MSLEVSIKKRLPAFTLDVAFNAGDETLGFLGASGCGKSLTLRCIAGVETPDEGRIVVNGTVFFDSEAGVNLSPQQRKTALLFQNYQLFPNMSVGDNIAAGIDRKLGDAERKKQVRRFLELFCLQGFEDRYPMRLSGGQQQRVALARMLAARPQILMLDEPFSALDAHLKGTLEQSLLKLFELYRGTILYVSHDIDEAFRFCKRIAVVADGHLAEVGPAGKIVQNPETLATIKLSGCKNISRCKKTGPHEVEACDWGMRFALPDGIEADDSIAYLGIQARDIHATQTGEADENSFELEVERVLESRFSADAICKPPAGEPGARIWLTLDKGADVLGAEGATPLPSCGDKLRLNFDVQRLHLVTR